MKYAITHIKGENKLKQEKIIVKCYGKEQEYKSRKAAIQEFREAAEWSDGCEKERYMNILLDLYDGKTYCTDGE